METPPGDKRGGAISTSDNANSHEGTIMSTSTRRAQHAQAASSIRRPIFRDYTALTPREIARKQRNIRIARAVALVARTACDCTTAARAVFGGVARFRDVLAIRDACDQQCIPRKHNWGSELRVWSTVEPASAYVRPRDQGEGG